MPINARQRGWLTAALQEWRDDGLISAEQAAAIASRYPEDDRGGWARTFIYGLGFFLIGLGVILFFAYNWQGMDKLLKLALVFGVLAGAHGAGWLMARDGRQSGISEGLHLFGSVMFGAGIWLVAQIYHMDEHYPNALLVWGLGALALAWIMPSRLQAALALFLTFAWCGSEVLDFRWHNHVAPALVGALIIPLAWRLRSRSLFFLSLALFAPLALFNLLIIDDDSLPVALLAYGGVYLAAAVWVRHSVFPDGSGPLLVLGAGIYLPLLFFMTFDAFDPFLIRFEAQYAWEWLYLGVPLLLGAGLWIWLLAQPRRLPGVLQRSLGTVMAASMITLCLSSTGASLPLQVIFNLLFLAHSVLLLTLGLRQLQWPWVALGSAMLAALTLARFLDLFESLLLRSLTFLLIGAGIVAVSLLYSRLKQRRQAMAEQVS